MDAKWTTKESIWKHMENILRLYGIQWNFIDTYGIKWTLLINLIELNGFI
jgi:hypothetical protein